MRASTFGFWIAATSIALGVGLAWHGIAAADGARAIYRCEQDGVLTFSDRPCAPSAERHELDPDSMNTYEAPPAPPTSRGAGDKPKSTRRPSSPGVDPNKHKATCERLAQGLKDIRAKLRSGYSASERERIKERQARLKSQLRTARCR